MKIIQIIEIIYDDCLCNLNDITHYSPPVKITIDKPLKSGDKLEFCKNQWFLKRGDD